MKLSANVIAFWFQVEYEVNVGWLYDWPMEIWKIEIFVNQLINFEFVQEEKL